MPKIKEYICPVCKKTKCYHCASCWASLDEEEHHITCMHVLLSGKRCAACQGTGISSRGHECFPCNGYGVYRSKE